MLGEPMALQVRRTIVIAPSNVGDAVLTVPMVAQLAQYFPKAQLTIAGGPRAAAVYDSDPRVTTYLCYGGDAHTWRDRLRVVGQLRAQRADVMLDLRHTLLPWLVRARWRTRPLRQPPRTIQHRHARYQWYLDHVLQQVDPTRRRPAPDADVWMLRADELALVAQWQAHAADRRIVVVSAGARSDDKRWSAASFAQVCSTLARCEDICIVLTGELSEQSQIAEVERNIGAPVLNLVGCTTVRTLAGLIQRSAMVMTNDSAALHVASSVNTPTVALFGPTDPDKYGPRSDGSIVHHAATIAAITVADVVASCERFLTHDTCTTTST
jgi:heptosyltransferase II